MPRLLIASACALFFAAGPAAAISSFDQREIESYAHGVDLSGLTNLQVLSLLAIIHQQSGEGRKGRQVRAYLLHVNGESILSKLLR